MISQQSVASSSVHVFAFPELLPASMRLLLDLQSNTAIVLHLDGKEVISFHDSFLLTPSSARVFLALLQAYPRSCTHRSLFTLLYPLPSGQEAGRWWEKELARRPIRRALVTLLPVLRYLGLQVVSLRGQGYVLAAMTDVVAVVRANAGRK